MGLCPSRQSQNKVKQSLQPVQLKAIQPQPERTLRPDAPPFRPSGVTSKPSGHDDAYTPKEPWELFLSGKEGHKASGNNQFVRSADGSYTSEYRRLLGEDDRMPQRQWSQAAEAGGSNLRWGGISAKKMMSVPASGPKKKKTTTLKKAIMAGRETNDLWSQFDQHLYRALSDPSRDVKATMESLEALDRPERPKDDADVASDIIPYGLSDLHYLSDADDRAGSRRHIEKRRRAPIREYVKMAITPALEDSITRMLYRLRALKMAERSCGIQRRRYTVGFREVTRMLQGPAKALIVAPDVERTAGALEAKIASLCVLCKQRNVPVIYALSRRQLGAAICKNVAVSVFGIQDIHGVEDMYNDILNASQDAREAFNNNAVQ